MLSLLERQIGSQPIQHSSSRPSRTIGAVVALVVIASAIYITFFLLPSFSDESLEETLSKQQKQLLQQQQQQQVSQKKKNKNVETNEHHQEHQKQASHHHPSNDENNKKEGGGKNVDVIVEPWGYNKNRNVPRWTAIRNSIEKDNHPDPFVIVDYGSDQGFFSVSAAHHFNKQGAFVVSVELGGVGGEIWKKKVQEGQNDVLSIQERKVSEYQVEKNFMICQTKISPKMFFDMAKRNQTHRYQFVLSIFHWFDLPSRKHFEAAIVALFRNSQSTFIELPTIGDRSALIRKQVGWHNFEKWYDGRSDIAQIILDAAAAHHFPVKVTKIVSVPWLRWTRDMYRVDWHLHSPNSQYIFPAPLQKFTCQIRREEIYHCNKEREKLQKCQDVRSHE